MRLDPRAFGIAAGAVAAVTYVICGLLVAVAPDATQATFSYIMHADLTGITRPISVASFAVGLVIFGAFVGLCGYFTARLYNALGAREGVTTTCAAVAAR
jgi:hypothetical protein